MEREAVVQSAPQQPMNERPSFLVLHGEMTAAIVSGILIVIGWVLMNQDYSEFGIGSFILAYVIGGFAKAKEGIEETIKEKELNVEMLMLLAAIGSAIIGYWLEGALLIFIFALSGALETYTMNRSERELTSLMELQPEEATVLYEGKEKTVSLPNIKKGDILLIKPGERVPLDGTILSGQTSIDQAAITGEAVPVFKEIGSEVYAGTVNVNGAVTVEVTKPAKDTLFQKIITLVQQAQNEKSPSQLFIEKFESVYVKAVLIIVALMMFLPHFLLDWSWTETFYRAMILLVVASPCALVAAITPASLSAISYGARHGILFKSGLHLERLAHLEAIAFDKTGTLTKGTPAVTDVVTREAVSEEEFLYIVASIERYSHHPLAQSIVQHAQSKITKELKQPEQLEDVPGFGVIGTLNNQEIKIGKREFFEKEAHAFRPNLSESFATERKTVVYAKDDQGIIGMIALKDIIRPEAKEAISVLNELGIKTVMLTGDSEKTASAISKECSVENYIAGCLPEEKVTHVKALKQEHETVAMVGDGINDAPALAHANIGIAMGEGTDVALETADIVLMKNNLSKIAQAVKLSKKMNAIVKQNIIFSISIIVLLICSNFLQFLDLPLGVIGHEGSTILVILNGLRLLKN